MGGGIFMAQALADAGLQFEALDKFPF